MIKGVATRAGFLALVLTDKQRLKYSLTFTMKSARADGSIEETELEGLMPWSKTLPAVISVTNECTVFGVERRI